MGARVGKLGIMSTMSSVNGRLRFVDWSRSINPIKVSFDTPKSLEKVTSSWGGKGGVVVGEFSSEPDDSCTGLRLRSLLISPVDAVLEAVTCVRSYTHSIPLEEHREHLVSKLHLALAALHARHDFRRTFGRLCVLRQ